MKVTLGIALILAGVLALALPGEAAAKVGDGTPISAIAAGEGAVWAWANTYELVRVDPRSMRITSRTDTRPALITDLAVGEGAVWGAGFCGRPRCRYGVLVRFDPRTGRRSRPLTRLGLRPRALAVGHGAVWVLGGRRVLRIDPATRRMEGPAIAIGRNGRDIAVGAGAVWVITGERRDRRGRPRCDLVGIDPARREVFRRQPIPCGSTALDVGAGRIWATAPSGTRGLVRVRPRGALLPLRDTDLPGGSLDVAAGPHGVWVLALRNAAPGPRGAVRGEAVVVPLDACGRSRGDALSLGPAFEWQPRIALGAGAVWVANAPTGTIRRLDRRRGVPSGRISVDRLEGALAAIAAIW